MRAAIGVDAALATRRGGEGGGGRGSKAPLSRQKRRRFVVVVDDQRKRSRFCKAKSSSFSSCQVWDVVVVRDKKSGCAFLATVETVREDGRIECVVLERERERNDEAVYVETSDLREIAREDVVAVVSDSLLFSQRMDSDRASNPHGEHSTNIWVAEKSTADAIERGLAE
jgi:predicted nucleic acid-binding Zn finger protein